MIVLLAYLILSLLLSILVASTYDGNVRDVEPTLGRRIVIILLVPGTLLLVLLLNYLMVLFDDLTWEDFWQDLKDFPKNVKEAWDGR